MSNTVKEKIESIIFQEYEEDREKFKKLNKLLNKFDEEQLKELYEDLMINQITTYQTIYNYAYEFKII